MASRRRPRGPRGSSRASEISALCSLAGYPQLADRLIARRISLEDARREVWDRRVEDAGPEIRARPRSETAFSIWSVADVTPRGPVCPVERFDATVNALVRSGRAKDRDDAARRIWLHNMRHVAAINLRIDPKQRNGPHWDELRARFRDTYGTEIDGIDLTLAASAKGGDRQRQIDAVPAIAAEIRSIVQQAWRQVSEVLARPLPGTADSYRKVSRRLARHSPDLFLDERAPAMRLHEILASLAGVALVTQRESWRLRHEQPRARVRSTKSGDPGLNQAAAHVGQLLRARHPQAKVRWEDVADVLEYHGYEIRRRHDTRASRADRVRKAASRFRPSPAPRSAPGRRRTAAPRP